MEVTRAAFVCFFLTAVSVPSCLACNGYEIASQKIENCNPNGDDIVKLDNFKVTINDDCTVKVDGCIELMKQITSATGSYLVKKDFISLNGKKDICKELEKANVDVVEAFKFLKVKPSCPIEAVKACGPPGTFNITKYKSYFSMLKGNAVADLKLEADSGPACVKATVKIVKK